MLRVIKPEGFGNIQLEDVPLPEVGPRNVLVRTQVTLISRGSELLARYSKTEAVSPEIMGYSLTGHVEQIGSGVTEYAAGDRVMVVAPHSDFALGQVDGGDVRRKVVPLPDGVSFEEGTFLPLVTSAVAWAEAAGIQPGDTVVILGQGLVGNLVMQAVKAAAPGRIVVVDGLSNRCAMAADLGADVVVNASEQDPVGAVRELTGGHGADVVIDCVGGQAGIRSFEQAQDMVRPRGTLQLISLYHGAPLPLHASKVMNRRIIAGMITEEPYDQRAARAAEAMRNGNIRVAPLITHRLPYHQARAAFDLLWERPGEALGVLLLWNDACPPGD